VVEGGCPSGSAAVVDVLVAEGASLGITTTLGADGRGSISIPSTLFPQRLFVRAECRDDTGPAINFAELALISDQIEPQSESTEYQSEPIEYQPGVFLSLFEPTTCDSSLRPVMLTSSPGDAAEFAERGYLGVVVEARNPGNSGRLDTEMIQSVGSATNDFAVAVQWLRANAEQYCVEPDAIAAMGHSFWGITALALAYSEGELAEDSVITLDEFDASATVGSPPPLAVPPDLAGFSNDINAAVSFSGFALTETIDAGEPPAILFHGRDDSTVPFALAEKTSDAATAVEVTCELIPHDSCHGRADDIDAAWDTIAEFLAREMLAPAGITLES
jgi:dienelactone hydrolase